MSTLHEALLSETPGAEVRQWLDAGGFEKYAELGALRGVTQGKEYHRLDVLEHSLEALDHTAGLSKEAATRLAGFLHDIGKPATRTEKDGKISFNDHAEIGAGMIPGLLERLVADGELPTSFLEKDGEVSQAVARCHMRVHWLADGVNVTDKAVNKLTNFCDTFLAQIFLVCRADRKAQYQQTAECLDRLYCRIIGLGEVRAAKQKKVPGSQFLSGEEIAELLGGPGPLVGEAKAALVDAESYGAIKSKEEAAILVCTFLPPKLVIDTYVGA